MFWRWFFRGKSPRVVECSLYLCGRCGAVHGSTQRWTVHTTEVAVCPVCAMPGTKAYQLAYDPARCTFLLRLAVGLVRR